jgi:hypothetical protein
MVLLNATITEAERSREKTGDAKHKFFVHEPALWYYGTFRANANGKSPVSHSIQGRTAPVAQAASLLRQDTGMLMYI